MFSGLERCLNTSKRTILNYTYVDLDSSVPNLGLIVGFFACSDEQLYFVSFQVLKKQIIRID